MIHMHVVGNFRGVWGGVGEPVRGGGDNISLACRNYCQNTDFSSIIIEPDVDNAYFY